VLTIVWEAHEVSGEEQEWVKLALPTSVILATIFAVPACP
jgi:hypothetical protein